jgi:hypothetical protein
VRQGGILAGHDYVDEKSKAGTEFGVVRAVQEFLTQAKVDVKYFHTTSKDYKTWMVYKDHGE